MAEGQKPSHYIYAPKPRDGEDPYWGEPIGAAWPHEDGHGFSLRLERIPVGPWDGRVVMRRRKPSEAEQ